MVRFSSNKTRALPGWPFSFLGLFSLAFCFLRLLLLLCVHLCVRPDYKLALDYSIRFYEAQRAGPLPASNRVAWRGNSVPSDGSDVSLPLSGGWFDAGDYVKFMLPHTYAAHMLAWGVYQYRGAYAAAGQLANALDQIKWATDFFIKAHPSANVFVGQVGDGGSDHGESDVCKRAWPDLPAPF